MGLSQESLREGWLRQLQRLCLGLIAERRSDPGLHAFVIFFPVPAELVLMRPEGGDAVQDVGTFRVYRAGSGLWRLERFWFGRFWFGRFWSLEFLFWKFLFWKFSALKLP
jgi:hypothetical protein